jgi:hypothetical protein
VVSKQRQELGDIFFGVPPTPIRQYMQEVFRNAKELYERLLVPCAGKFAIVEVAIAAGWPAERIECSDVSLFSALIGRLASGEGVDDLGITYKGELAEMAPAEGASPLTVAATYMLGLKLCQLNPEKYYKRLVREEMWAYRQTYIEQLEEQLKVLSGRLRGICYGIADVTTVCEAVVDDPRALLYLDPPVFKGGYTNMFDTKGLITWNDPVIPEFEPKQMAKLYRLGEGAPALVYSFRASQSDKSNDHLAVLAVERKPGKVDCILCNRPDEAAMLVKRKGETKIAPAKLKMLPDEYTITSKSKLAFVRLTKEQALYYRDLLAHKLGVSRTEDYYAVTLDGFMIGIFGMFMRDVRIGTSGAAFLTFAFCIPSPRYPRLVHLLMMVVTSGDAHKFFEGNVTALRPVENFMTTCFSASPDLRSHTAAGLKLLKRERVSEGWYKLSYAGEFRKETYRGAIASWLDKMRNVERQTGKPMGVTLLPGKEEKPSVLLAEVG